MRRHAGRRHIPPVVSAPVRITAGCSGKRCYSSKPIAARLAKLTRRERECRVEAYRCRHCHLWHIGEL